MTPVVFWLFHAGADTEADVDDRDEVSTGLLNVMTNPLHFLTCRTW